jgi:hypothetical protein
MLLLACAALDAPADDAAALGTLFQTPQERVAIDRARTGESPGGGESRAYSTLRPNPVITGYVKRSDGKDTVFVDNQPFEVKGAKAERLLQPRNVQPYVAPPPPPPPAAVPAAPEGSRPRTPAVRPES